MSPSEISETSSRTSEINFRTISVKKFEEVGEMFQIDKNDFCSIL